MDAGTDVEPERPERVPDLDGTADRAGRPVERGQEPVPGGVELLAREASELAANRRVVLVEEGSPARVPEILHPLGRADEIGEEDGGQHAVGSAHGTRPGEELLDLVEDLVGVDGHEVVVACELDVARARDLLGDVAPLLDLHVEISGAVQHERRAADAREQLTDVRLRVHQDQVARAGRAQPRAAAPLEPGRSAASAFGAMS